MRGRSLVAVLVVASMTLSSSAIAATAPPVMSPISCISTGMNARVVATVAPPLTSPRVFFRANGERTEYYVDMKRGSKANEWVAILPSIETSTKSVTYRVGAMDANKAWVVAPPVTISSKSSCPALTLSADDQRSANNIVLGLTTAGQSEVPPGFSCRGIASIIDYDCKLRPADGCRRLLAQGRTGVPAIIAAAGASGLSNAALLGLAAAGLGLGLLVYYSDNEGGSGGGAASPSRP